MASISGIVASVAALIFAVAGTQMISLHSEAGNTVAELFDHAMGLFSLGMAALVLLGGLAVDQLIAMRPKSPKPVASDPGLPPWIEKPRGVSPKPVASDPELPPWIEKPRRD